MRPLHCVFQSAACTIHIQFIRFSSISAKPSKPKGPLEVSDVHAEGCKLKWDKPEDDGGQPIENYVVEKMDTETGRWVPVGTTKTPEMEVEGLVPGKEYKFRVKAANAEGESDPLETDAPTLAKNPYGKLLSILSAFIFFN